MLQWEALGAGDRKPIAEEERRKAWVEGTERIRDAQRAGLLHQDLDAEYLVLALMALTIFPQAFPQVVRMVTGARLSDAEFQQRQARFLRRLGICLQAVVFADRRDDGHGEGEVSMSSVQTARFGHSTETSTARTDAAGLYRVALWVLLGANHVSRLGRAVGHPVARADRSRLVLDPAARDDVCGRGDHRPGQLRRAGA